jgi:hypothetical protein
MDSNVYAGFQDREGIQKISALIEELETAHEYSINKEKHDLIH